MRVLVTGASGNAGQVVCRELQAAGVQLRMADVTPPGIGLEQAEFVRCDTRTESDARRAVEGMDAVIHLAAWHCAHVPPVSDETIFAVNVGGTFNVVQACRAEGVRAFIFASSMAYGWGSVYSVSKVLGEDLCRMFHEVTGAPVAMLRYHDFVPKGYLAFGAKLLRNAVDRRDVAKATVAALRAATDRRYTRFTTIVHTNHGMPAAVVQDFRRLGPDWCDEHLPGASRLMEKYGIDLPERVEQHDLSEAAEKLDWRPAVGFLDFLADLKRRDERGEDVRSLWTPSDLSVVEQRA